MAPRAPQHPHSVPAREIAAALQVDPRAGLSDAQARQRLGLFGPNELRERKPRSWLAILAHQVRSIIVYLLAVAAVFSVATGDVVEAATIGVVLLINTAIGFTTEWRAARSMEALRSLAVTRSLVRRNGRPQMIGSQDIVPGDVVLLTAGDVITADLRLVRAAGLQCNESALTGESVPVDKDAGPVASGTELADRTCMAYKGTAITRGTAEGIVTGTGMQTEIGRISALVEHAEAETTPLEERLDRLGRKLIGLMLAAASVTVAVGILRGYPLIGIIETGVALAVAAVPEGLPVVATLCLAQGMWRMARANALINRLSSVETLGATTLILTDKTGTLTENRMSVVRYLLEGGDVEAAGLAATDPGSPLHWAIRVGALCNSEDDSGPSDIARSDPLELALLEVARRTGETADQTTRDVEHAFDPGMRMMAHVFSEGPGFLYAVKGAPEPVIAGATRVLGPEGALPLDEAAKRDWLARNQAAAEHGLRCIALAMKHADRPGDPPYEGLTLVGLVALADPLRPDVPPAIAACRRAGIRVVMMTGDHAATAARIARDAGLCSDGPKLMLGRELGGEAAAAPAQVAETDVFARVAPETKLQIVRFFQEAGEVVAMTGDGVNDAPALSKADIGIAMGLRGTQVAREAADMVLRDDSFATIVSAVREGRVIFGNIRKFVLYLMSCNVSEVLVVALAVGAGLPAPLLPLQILFLNLVTDVFPAFALGMDRGDGGVLDHPPRDPSEPVMRRAEWRRVAVLGGTITIATLGAFVLALTEFALRSDQAVTVAFTTLALAQLWNVFNARPAGSRLVGGSDMRNPYVWAAITLCALLIAAALGLPGLSALLALPYPGHAGLALAVGMSILPLAVGTVILTRGDGT